MELRQTRACPKPGAKSLLQVSYLGKRVQGLEPSSTALPGHEQGAGSVVQQPEHEPVPYGDTSARGTNWPQVIQCNAVIGKDN